MDSEPSGTVVSPGFRSTLGLSACFGSGKPFKSAMQWCKCAGSCFDGQA